MSDDTNVLGASDIKGAIRPFCVAVDYDDTFSSCRETWTKVIEVLRSAGANVFCVTFRKPDRPVTDFPGDVFYTGGRPKAEAMHEIRQDVHVWIDDQPELIGVNPERAAIRAAIMARS